VLKALVMSCAELMSGLQEGYVSIMAHYCETHVTHWQQRSLHSMS
jgi:hypothetical protein